MRKSQVRFSLGLQALSLYVILLGLERDLGMTGLDYNVMLTVFYIPVRKFPPHFTHEPVLLCLI